MGFAKKYYPKYRREKNKANFCLYFTKCDPFDKPAMLSVQPYKIFFIKSERKVRRYQKKKKKSKYKFTTPE